MQTGDACEQMLNKTKWQKMPTEMKVDLTSCIDVLAISAASSLGNLTIWTYEGGVAGGVVRTFE